jgi:hypothetical protein
MSSEPGAVADRPRLVDAAFGLVVTAGVCVLAFAVLILFQVNPTVDREQQAAAARRVSAASLEQTLLVVALIALAIAVVYVALLVWMGLRLRAGHRRARVWLLLLTVLAVVPLNLQGLLVAVVLAVAEVLAFRRPVTEWLQRVERERAQR